MILPLVLRYLTPPVVAVLGLVAISAAVMSSVDSTILSISSMFTRNVYKRVIKPQVRTLLIRYLSSIASQNISLYLKSSNNELVWVMRTSIAIVGASVTTLALLSPSTYGLW